MIRSSRSLNDLTDPELPYGLENEANLKKNWSFSHLLELEESSLTDRKFENEFQWHKKNSKVGRSARELGSFRRKPTDNTTSLLERFQKRLAQEVLDVLEHAHESVDRDRTLLLEDLFYNSSSMIEQQVLEKLDTATMDKDDENRHMRMVRFLRGKNTKTRFYFELVSSYFCHSHNGRKMVDKMLPLCASLWSHELFPPIFALLLHRWLLTHDAKSGSVLRFNVFLKGTNQLFWFDLQHQTHRLKSVYYYLIESVCRQSLSKSSASNIPAAHLKEDFSRLICRFFFYYCNDPPSASDLKILLLSLPPIKRNSDRNIIFQSNNYVKGSKNISQTSNCKHTKEENKQLENPYDGEFKSQLDRFIRELIKHLPSIKREKVTIQYLNGCKILKKESISPYLTESSMESLSITLDSFISHGGPLFPSTKVRHAARNVKDELFPNGEMFRKAISFSVRLLQPLYWPVKLITWIKDSVFDILSWIPIIGPVFVTK